MPSVEFWGVVQQLYETRKEGNDYNWISMEYDPSGSRTTFQYEFLRIVYHKDDSFVCATNNSMDYGNPVKAFMFERIFSLGNGREKALTTYIRPRFLNE